MGEIVNLRRAKKARERAQADADAAANRAKHGQTRQDREAATRKAAHEARLLDGARLELARDGEAPE